MQLYIHRNGQQTGPYSLDDVRSYLRAGSLQPDDLVWYEGASDWQPVSSILGILLGNSPSPPPPRSSQTSGLAISSLILGILSFFTLGLTAIPAVICGHVSRANIRRSANKLSGGGLALAGLITGYFGFLLLLSYGWAMCVSSSIRERAAAIKCLSNEKQIALACKQYAIDHNGNFPKTLDQLMPEYLQDTHLFGCPMAKDQTLVGYEYFGGTDTDQHDKVLLRSKATTRDHKRVIVYSDGTGDIKRDER